MLSDKTFQNTLDLMRDYASAVSEYDRSRAMAQLLTLEQSMSITEQCEYAMALCAEVRGLTIEQAEEETGLDALKLETASNKTIETFVNFSRDTLITQFYNRAVTAAAHKALSLSVVQSDPTAIRAMGDIILAVTPTPKALMN